MRKHAVDGMMPIASLSVFHFDEVSVVELLMGGHVDDEDRAMNVGGHVFFQQHRDLQLARIGHRPGFILVVVHTSLCVGIHRLFAAKQRNPVFGVAHLNRAALDHVVAGMIPVGVVNHRETVAEPVADIRVGVVFGRTFVHFVHLGHDIVVMRSSGGGGSGGFFVLELVLVLVVLVAHCIVSFVRKWDETVICRIDGKAFQFFPISLKKSCVAVLASNFFQFH